MNGFKHWPLVLCTGAIVSTLMLCTYSINSTITHAAPERWRFESMSVAVSEMHENTAKIGKSVQAIEELLASERAEAAERRLMERVTR